ncbi:hypothetical protein KS4_28720 [Poriferisphaera corsica]|uniref:Uncharacterized protein n=1 Tax=Poriferisphaera corsica TaxID=2528020 RepID=A0A517YX56_9BACT|nr:hypothetical protein [Poriferisphaera corsica]QDU34797.1 hypothetical protein KS4_28720 [Poriferisphaera corsica]
MHKFLIVINILALTTLTLALGLTALSSHNGPRSVMAINRVQGFNTEAVKEHFPELVNTSSIDAYTTGRWIASSERNSAYLNLFLAYAIVIINLLIVIIHKFFLHPQSRRKINNLR